MKIRDEVVKINSLVSRVASNLIRYTFHNMASTVNCLSLYYSLADTQRIRRVGPKAAPVEVRGSMPQSLSLSLEACQGV